MGMLERTTKKHVEFRPKTVQGKTDTVKNAGINDKGKKTHENASRPLKQWNVGEGIVEGI